ncbi:unnamed protein product [Aphanomyces euteiches]
MVQEDIKVEEIPSPCAKMWQTARSELGVVGTQLSASASGWSFHIYYEIFISFPELHKQWTVRRTYQEFVDLHRQLQQSFPAKLAQRYIVLPRPSRVEFNLTTQARYASSAKRLKEKLNSYLHRLLELVDVCASPIFQTFFNPREQDESPIETSPSSASPSPPTLVLEKPVSPSNDSACSTATTSDASSRDRFSRRGSDWQLEKSLSLSSNISCDQISTGEKATLETLHQRRTPAHVLPPPSLVVKTTSNCSSVVLYGSSISLRTCGGLRLGLTKRSAWSGSQKMAAVAAGGAGIVLSGPVGLTLAGIASLSRHQLSKTYSLSISSKETVKHSEFLIESASALSGVGRAVHYNEPFRLLNTSRNVYLRVAIPVDSKRGYVSATSGATSASLFRWVSPLGYVGPVVCGAPACLQVVEAPWTDELLAVHKDFVTTDGSPAVFKLVLTNHPCLANEDMSRTVARPLPKPVVVRIMAYNVWFLPPVASSLLNLSPFKAQRAHAIPSALPPNVDLVVFCEAFDGGAKIVLATEMKRRGFLYETRNAGSKSSMKAVDSGVFCMSKYPLEEYDELLFGSAAAGDDKIADKGAIYVQMRKGGEVIHVVGTHMQAWESDAAIACREKQLEKIAAWIEDKKIPRRDALIYAGDFNIDKTADTKEYGTMLGMLKAANPETRPGTSEHSFDPFTNILASKGKSSGGKLERLDYVMYGTEFRKPRSCWTQVLPLKVQDGGWEDRSTYDNIVQDLSDHYPVLSEFHFG